MASPSDSSCNCILTRPVRTLRTGLKVCLQYIQGLVAGNKENRPARNPLSLSTRRKPHTPTASLQASPRTVLGDITSQFSPTSDAASNDDTATTLASAHLSIDTASKSMASSRASSRAPMSELTCAYVGCYNEDWTPRPGDSCSEIDYVPEDDGHWAERFDCSDENVGPLGACPPPPSRASGEL
ncbi:hypothetical protein PHLGIDRAFT_298824 [Phlebiopsis gigantea 11061_1 CR5-6]|uniref:Uncharacterized protein n=1 Tax=Phlebiopsis gigantea (strain 11061_1 CR5-6) TaxID=745531 RepID=A0A0C3NCW0_PHLG1|nr:hypothetical protein PHLGIDRAFT_298824 [Phlebiopsis gigantea 11061_1 CR5-6]